MLFFIFFLYQVCGQHSIESIRDLANATVYSIGDTDDDGYLLLTKLNSFEMVDDPQTSSTFPPECVQSRQNDKIVVDTYICPTFDLMVLVANTISTRMIVTPTTDVIPFQIMSTDLSGPRHKMIVEIWALDSLMYTQRLSINEDGGHLQLHTPSEIREFAVLDNCKSVSCFGRKAIGTKPTLWFIEGVQWSDSGDAVTSISEQHLGVWAYPISTSDDEETINFHFRLQETGGGSLSEEETLAVHSVDIATGLSSLIQAGTTTSSNLSSKISDAISSIKMVNFDLNLLPWVLKLETDSEVITGLILTLSS